MARPRHLEHDPITEALIDIHVEPRPNLSFTELQDGFRALDFGYYLKNSISEGTFAFALSPDGQHQSAAGAAQIGVRMHSQDEKFVAQCRLGGFTLSRLPPYETWPTLIQETKRLWSIYNERLAPVRVTRVATRFINNLRLPLEQGTSFQVYLNKFADVPDEAPQLLSSFFQRFELVDPQNRASVNLTLVLESNQASSPAPVILDVDAFSVTNLVAGDEEIWATLERLRVLKNQCFFGAITERAAELYK